jgi:Tol biopolymer transport system component
MDYRLARRAVPFQKFEMNQLTNGGKELVAAISPDGKYVAYASAESSFLLNDRAPRESLWLKQISGSEVRILPPTNVDYRALTFSPDGQFLYFVQAEPNAGYDSGTLYKIPVLGGRPQRLVRDIASGYCDEPSPSQNPGTVAVSPDGKRLAFERTLASKKESVLVVANEDGSEEKSLITRPASQGCGFPAWSPDGRTIATLCGSPDCAATTTDDNNLGNKFQLFWVPATGGPERPASVRAWGSVDGAAWLSDGRGLILNVQDIGGDPIQFAYVPYPSGEVRKLTSDLNYYAGLSLTADSRTIATLRVDDVFQLWTVPVAEPEHAKTVLTGGWDPAWTAAGSIVYVINSLKRKSVGIMDADGSNVHQLSDGSDMYVSAPRVSPDNRYVVFEGDRSGVMQVWRMDANGEHPLQLTSTSDIDDRAGIDVSYDGKWVFYARKINQEVGIWKVPIEGGEPVLLTARPAPGGGSFGSLAASPNGEFLAYVYPFSYQPASRGIALLPLKSSTPAKFLDIPANCVRWTPDSRSLVYSLTHNNISNIWMRQISGGQAKQITQFTSDLISGFRLSGDGKQLVIARGFETSHVLLIRDIQ